MLDTETEDVLLKIDTFLTYGVKDDNIKNRKRMTLQHFKSLFSEKMINEVPKHSQYNILETAVLNNYHEIVKYLLSFNGWNVNHQNQNGETILQFISDNEHFDLSTAKALLDYAVVDNKIHDKWENNPVFTSIFNLYSNTVNREMKNDYYIWLNELLQKGFRPNTKIYNFALNVVKDPNVTKLIVEKHE